MAHLLESMFYTGKLPWHGLGTFVEQAPTPEDAIVAAGLNWEVKCEDVFTKDESSYNQVPGAKAVVRSTDRRVLGVVTDKYHPLQNKDAFSWFQPWIDSNSCTMEIAGSLKNGEIVWVLAKVTDSGMPVVKDDVIDQYILLSNNHNGLRAVTAGFTAIRVVCANTLGMAYNGASRGDSKLLRLRHSENLDEAMKLVQAAMDLNRKDFMFTMNEYRALAKVPLTAKMLEDYLKEIFAKKVESPEIIDLLGLDEDETEEEGEKTTLKVSKKIMNAIVPLFEGGKGNQLPGVRGTLWAAYNAVTEWLSYDRGRSQDTRLESLWWGQSAKVNDRALTVARKMARAA